MGVLLLQDEGDLHVDLVAGNVALLDHDIHILDPSTLHTPERASGTAYALLDSILEAAVGDRADLGYPCDRHALQYSFPQLLQHSGPN
jgi:hypothetical protein